MSIEGETHFNGAIPHEMGIFPEFCEEEGLSQIHRLILILLSNQGILGIPDPPRRYQMQGADERRLRRMDNTPQGGASCFLFRPPIIFLLFSIDNVYITLLNEDCQQPHFKPVLKLVASFASSLVTVH